MKNIEKKEKKNKNANKDVKIRFIKLSKEEWEQINGDPKTIRINDFDPLLQAIC